MMNTSPAAPWRRTGDLVQNPTLAILPALFLFACSSGVIDLYCPPYTTPGVDTAEAGDGDTAQTDTNDTTDTADAVETGDTGATSETAETGEPTGYEYCASIEDAHDRCWCYYDLAYAEGETYGAACDATVLVDRVVLSQAITDDSNDQMCWQSGVYQGYAAASHHC